MENISLSFIIATRNRLPFLKITLENLINDLHPGEEIVVVDGNSTDGSKEYIRQLFEDGKIHQFVSEPDKNQAHAWNKAMLMAKGTIIKKIIDDDVFCYSAIRRCKDYMLANPPIDVMISNDMGSSLGDYKKIGSSSRLPQFIKWKDQLVPSFTFGDVHLLIRKSSLAYIGLYNTGFVMMDWEYSLRISYLKANIAYYTGYNALNVAHLQSVTSLKNKKVINNQGRRACALYEYPGDSAEITLWSKTKIFVGKRLKRLKKATQVTKNTTDEDIHLMYNHYYNFLNEVNNEQNFTIINS